MTHIFDEKSGIRERLYLLAVLPHDDNTANWAYNPHHDAWHHVSGKVLKVRWEASRSLDLLAKQGYTHEESLHMVTPND